jgi:hypothetical protein
MDRVAAEQVMTAATTTGAQSVFRPSKAKMNFQASGETSAGAGAAAIVLQGSLDGTNWEDIGTVTLTLATTTSSDSFAIDNPWDQVRVNVSSISGTDASVDAWLAVEF